jgi:hypothetical protein
MPKSINICDINPSEAHIQRHLYFSNASANHRCRYISIHGSHSPVFSGSYDHQAKPVAKDWNTPEFRRCFCEHKYDIPSQILTLCLISVLEDYS